MQQSIAYWCLADTEWGWDAGQICQLALKVGAQGIELAPLELFPLLAKHSLQCSLTPNGMPGAPFARGLNNLAYHEEIITRTKHSIDLCSEYEFPNVIAFTGYKWRNADDPASGEIPLEEGMKNCVKGLRELSPYAAAKGVTVCLEHLNSRDSSHPMKGHPGYQGDNVEVCADIVRQVNSHSVRLLFDVYHVQVMHGDVIRRLRALKDLIGHIHTAGCPGRNEFNDKQEIHYPGIAAAIREIGYGKYIGHEFIPVGDPTEAFAGAIELFKN
jgi:hydroxypyruvate isomerase